MEWVEKQPLPECCKKCRAEDCYNCDWAGHRWFLPDRDMLVTRRKMLMRAIERLQKQLEEIDALLQQPSK